MENATLNLSEAHAEAVHTQIGNLGELQNVAVRESLLMRPPADRLSGAAKLGGMNALTLRRLWLSILAAAVLIGCWVTPFDRVAREQVTEGLQRALTAFAAARALGAVIAVAQSTQVDVKPAGVGVSLAPGQVLQPLNELVDRFGAVMLAASVAFGIQLLLLTIGAHPYASILVSAAALIWLGLNWRTGSEQRVKWFRPVLVGLLLVRFLAPVSGLANEAVYRTFMADDYRTAMATIDQPAATVAGPGLAPTGGGVAERLRNWWQGLSNFDAAYERILAAASSWTQMIVRLMAVFILQTIVLPVAFLWGAWRLVRFGVMASSRSTGQPLDPCADPRDGPVRAA